MRVACIILLAAATLLASCDAATASKVSTMVSSNEANAVLHDSPVQRSLRAADKPVERMLQANVDKEFTIAVLDKMVANRGFRDNQLHRWYMLGLDADRVKAKLHQAKPREKFPYHELYEEYVLFLRDPK
ncbi:hypothetical protein PHYBOEH_006469 [Phytophthora boehmeriae]|uniref:RxLR effector protein n=1 Tax=Phytophthora boehmeriae TaxID=109152 RepID=A0A8T1WJN8_9STRA|nr:hypothetical protein PHYBOEH_006469 [Phytophthora boehmeriae]